MAYMDCPYTPGVVCDGRPVCNSCGWYPPEDKRRLQDIRDGKMHKGLWGKSRLRLKKKSRSSRGQEVPG